MESDRIGKTMNMVNSISYGLKTNAHVNDLITTAHKIISAEFIVHMSSEAFNNPKAFQHMYEWGRAGDPNAALWKHLLRGSGSSRVATFDFKASKTAVPVSAAKQSVGVQSNHIFVWKAPILELGLPVRISPKLAKYMVLDPKGSSELIYTNKTIYIPRQGSSEVWGSFTNEYMRWVTGAVPLQIIKSQLEPKVSRGIKSALSSAIRKLGPSKKTKTFNITPVGIDKNFVTTMNNSLRANYIGAAAQRRMQDD